MKTKLLILALAATCCVKCVQQSATTAAKPAIAQAEYTVDPDGIISLVYDDDLMREAKAAYEAKDTTFMRLLKAYQTSMDNNLNREATSLSDGIIHIPPSGDPRDYITTSPYWWPDPDTEDGTPYIRSDGLRNPETNEYPGRTLGTKMASSAQGLGFLYYITGEERYAAKVTEIVRTWYLDPVKGMNPNIVFAQYVPGMQRIRGTGLLEASRTAGVLNAIKMISGSESWTEQDEAQMQDWAKAFLYWIEYSTHGQEEHKGANNHAMWYETVRQIITLYTKDYNHLADIIVKYQYPRLSTQVAADSTLPHETARTLGLHYSTYVLSAVAQTAIMANKIGIDKVWTHVGENGRGMLWALDYLIPYWRNPETWPYMQIAPAREPSIINILHQVYKETKDEKYKALAEEIRFNGIASGRDAGVYNLLFYKLHK